MKMRKWTVHYLQNLFANKWRIKPSKNLNEGKLTSLTDGAALIGLVLRVHALSLGTGRHRAQHLSTGLTAAFLTWRNLEKPEQILTDVDNHQMASTALLYSASPSGTPHSTPFLIYSIRLSSNPEVNCYKRIREVETMKQDTGKEPL